MQCVEVTERLLSAEIDGDPRVEQHLSTCQACARVMAGLDRLEDVLQNTLLVSPPFVLQQQLTQLAIDAARPQLAPWWQRLGEFDLSRIWAQRPQVLAGQGLAAIMLSIIGWQVFGLLSTVQPVLGDVGYAMQLVAASPATVSLSGIQIDLQSLGLWSLVGLGGWLVADDSLIGRGFRSRSLRP